MVNTENLKYTFKYLEMVERIKKCPYVSFDDLWLVTA